MGVIKAGLSILFAFALTFPVAKANINGDGDDAWEKRAEEASKTAREAFHPNPIEVANHLNHQVHLAFFDNRTRRHLTEGSCEAINPIDKCWRCDPDWAKNRKKLADCVLGFGSGTTGGKDGEFYEVTNPADDDLVNPKPGTLRFGAIQDKPLWITFARDMVIRLSEELIVTSSKTIDGRGANVRIENGARITIYNVKNVIIHGITISGIKPGKGGMIKESANKEGNRGPSDGDGITVFGSSNIWIDHVSMSKCEDGLIDVTMGSTAVTISNSLFTDHDKAVLLGADAAHKVDEIMQVTVAFNHFGKGLVQRMPRVRFGFAHVVNNDYTQWQMYAIGGSQNPTILSQGNRFVAPPNANAKEVTKRQDAPESEWKNWNWRSENDLLVDGAFFVESGSPNLKVNTKELIPPKPGTEVEKLTQSAGVLACSVGKPC